MKVAHILGNGKIESQIETENRLLEAEGLAGEDFFSREERLRDAYRARSRTTSSPFSKRASSDSVRRPHPRRSMAAR